MTKSVLSNWFGLVWAGLVSFALTPLMIHHLGAVYYGMWILAASLLDYYGLVDMAMRVALFRFVSRFKGAGERAALNDTISTALVLAGVIGAFLLVLIPLCALRLPHFFGLHGAQRSLFQWLCALVGLSLIVNIPARVLGSYLCGFQRFDLYNLSGVLTVTLRGLAIATALFLGYGVLSVAVATFAACLFALGLNYRLLRRADPGLVLDCWRPNWGRARELVGYGTYAFFNVGGESLRSYTDAVVIARVLSLALVTPFSVATKLMEYFKSIMSAISGPTLGVMSEMDGRPNRNELPAYFLASTRYMSLLSLFLAAILILDGRYLIRFWLGPSFEQSFPLVQILTAGYVLSFAQYPAQLVAFAKARHKPLALLTLAEGLLNLFLSIIWGKKYGLMGVALGTTAPLLVANVAFQPWYALRLVSLSPSVYVKDALLRPFVVCATFLIVFARQLAPVADLKFLSFCAVLGLQAVSYGLLVFFIGLSRSERQSAWQRIRKLAGSIQFAVRNEVT